MNSQYKWLIGLAALCCSCSKPGMLDDVLGKGEIVYPGKADTVIVNGGKERMQLVWATSDSRITHFRVFWNGGADSMEVKAAHTGQLSDTTRVMLENMPEARYTFNVFSYDASGNRSIRAEAEGAAYGAAHRNTLLNRGLKRAIVAADGAAELEWMPADSLETLTTVRYTDNNGAAQTLQVLPGDQNTRLLNYRHASPFTYSTAYLPEKRGLDTFYAKTETVPAALVPLDKSKFKALSLPGDAGTAWGWVLPYLWDNSIAEGKGYHTPDLNLPQHFNFDLGVTVELREFKWWQRQGSSNIYNQGNPKRFEIWGSNSPAANGSYTGWSLISDCRSVKPSGSAVGTVTMQDTDYAAAGELFKFPEGTPPYRYIRIKVLERWSTTSKSIHMMEVSFWAKPF